jgi:hypothetical protein
LKIIARTFAPLFLSAPDQVSLATKLMDDFGNATLKLGNDRVEVRVSEMEGETKLALKTYKLFLQRNAPQQLNIGALPPAQAGILAQDKSKVAEEQRLYQKIDCRINSDNDETIALAIQGMFSDFAAWDSPKQSLAEGIHEFFHRCQTGSDVG